MVFIIIIAILAISLIPLLSQSIGDTYVEHNKEKIVENAVDKLPTVNVSVDYNIPRCPVKVEKIELKFWKGSLFSRIYFINDSGKIINAMSYYSSCYNSFGHYYGDVNCLLQDLNVNPKDLFGYGKGYTGEGVSENFDIPYPGTRKINVHIKEIMFSDGSAARNNLKLYQN